LTDRLRHSEEGYIRALQMSQVALFLFVEGATDRFFYSELGGQVCAAYGLDYEIRLARELPVATGGKAGLLEFFDMLGARGQLSGHFSGRRWSCVIHVDKDLDDVSGKLRTSPHVIYTEHYHLENYFFLHGDIARVLRVAGKLPADAAAKIAHPGWQRKAAGILREWVVLCVASVTSDAPCGINYRSFSRVHSGPPWTCQPDALTGQKEVLQAALSPATFLTAWDTAEHLVAYLYANGRQDSVFKGRWYANYLLAEIKATDPESRDVSLDAILALSQQTLDFAGAWASSLRKAIAEVIENTVMDDSERQ
jgi:hypothetical protein